MSTTSLTTNRYGWFDHDPLAVTSGAVNPQPNHFIADERTGGRSYSSLGAGAAVVDDVRLRIGADPEQVVGDFESASDIDNDPAVSALAAWKSTGKPPPIHYHAHPFATLLYRD